MRNGLGKTIASAALAAMVGLVLQGTARATLVAYYPLDGNLNDTSGNGNNGTGAANLTFGASGSGQSGGAGDEGILVNGTSTTQYFTSPVDVSPDAMPQVTFGGWFKSADLSGTTNRGLLIDDKGGFGRGINLDIRTTTHGYAGFNGGSAPFGGVAPSPTGFDFVAITYNSAGSGTAMLDVNGVFFTSTGEAAVGDSTLTIGRSQHFDSPFSGTIDDVFIFNTALSQAQLNSIQTSGVPEPATCGLFAVASICALARRRRA